MKTRIASLLAALFLTVSSAWGATFNLFQPASGILVGNPSTYVTTAATSANVIALWSGTCNSTTFLRADGTCQVIAAAPTPANPTASVGLTAVNGAATTYMRSDAAPLLSQAIAPTWTGAHLFNNGANSGSLVATGVRGNYGLFENDAAADNGRWRILADLEQLSIETLNDAASSSVPFFFVNRTGTVVDSIALAATAITLNGVAATDFGRLSQSQTWTGTQLYSASAPRTRYNATAAGVDEKQWAAQVFSSGTFSLNTRTDADGTGADALLISRTGTAVTTTAFNTATFQVNATTAANFSNAASTNTFAGPVRLTASSAPAISTSTTSVTSRSGGTDVVANAQVSGTGAPDSSASISRAVTSTAAPILFLNKARNTLASPNVVASADQVARIIASGYDGTNYSNAAEIAVEVDGTPGAGDMPGRLILSTTADGASTPTERLRIANNGAWGLAGATFGTAGNVLTSNGSGSAPTWQAVAGGAAGANPTASVGLTAVNGAAATFLRSDGAPPLDQAIAPTWTGAHIFSNAAAIKATGTVGLEIENAAPVAVSDETDAPANERAYLWRAVAGDLALSTATDAAPTTAVNNAILIQRTGTTVDTVNLTATNVQANGSNVCTASGTGCPAGSGASATAGGATSATNAALTAVALSTEDFDTGNFHDLVTNNSRVILPSSTGYANCTGTITATGGATTLNTYFDMTLFLRKNGTDYIAVDTDQWLSGPAGATNTMRLQVAAAMVPANGTDYVEMVVLQNGGTTAASVRANSTTSSAATTRLTCSRI